MTAISAIGRAARFLSTDLSRGGRGTHFAIRAAGAAFLDRAFELESPLPPLPPAWRAAIETTDVILPGRSRLARGNQDHAGLLFLVSLASWLEARTVFEIGTYNGMTAHYLALNVPAASVQTLDLPPDQGAQLAVDEGDSLHVGMDVLDAARSTGRVGFHYGDSATFDFGPFAGSCELVYVDGAHSYDYVMSDTARALDLLTRRAAIVWDDYHRGMRGVAAALQELSRSRALFRVPSTRLAVHFTHAAIEALQGGAR